MRAENLESLEAPEFLCDAMLGHVGRRLRSAGYDTWIEDGKLSDEDVARLARESNRLLLTCDVEFSKTPRGANVLFQSESDEEAWALKLAREAKIDWMRAPFTRCLDCNTQLVAATDEQRQLMPANIQRYQPPGLHCPTCKKLFWEGTHTDRMRARLQRLKDIATSKP